MLSLGSNGDFKFETAIFKIFGRHARIHTFDCTIGSAVPPMLSGVVTYHQICVGVPERTDRKGRQFLSWGSLMDRLQAAGQLVGKVEMMKIDVEGHERNFLWDMMTRGDARRVGPTRAYCPTTTLAPCVLPVHPPPHAFPQV